MTKPKFMAFESPQQGGKKFDNIAIECASIESVRSNGDEQSIIFCKSGNKVIVRGKADNIMLVLADNLGLLPEKQPEPDFNIEAPKPEIN